jgi:hypothetical protein
VQSSAAIPPKKRERFVEGADKGPPEPPAAARSMNYADLTDAELHRLTRRRLQDQPTDELEWHEIIAELRALSAEIMARVERECRLLTLKRRHRHLAAAIKPKTAGGERPLVIALRPASSETGRIC